jgi:hypothetical protein
MALGSLYNITSQLFNNHVSSGSISEILIIVGLIIIGLMLLGGISYGLFKAFSAIPRMSTKQFILFMLLLAGALIVIGIILP